MTLTPTPRPLHPAGISLTMSAARLPLQQTAAISTPTHRHRRLWAIQTAS